MYVFNFLTRIQSKLVLNLNLKGGRKEKQTIFLNSKYLEITIFLIYEYLEQFRNLLNS